MKITKLMMVSLLVMILSIFVYQMQEVAGINVSDINHDGIIQKGEAIMTIVEYFEGNATKAAAIDVVVAYFTGQEPIPTPTVVPRIFGIYNTDSVEHEINIQILDSNNTQFINKTYKLEPSYTASYPETEWQSAYDRDRIFPNGTYIFKIILDGNITNTYRNAMDTWSEVYIDIVAEDTST